MSTFGSTVAFLLEARRMIGKNDIIGEKSGMVDKWESIFAYTMIGCLRPETVRILELETFQNLNQFP
jgi:hypothetical protein